MVKSSVPTYSPAQEESEFFCLITLCQWNGELWSLVHMTFNRSYVPSWILPS